ncbi:MAG: Trm112 family protein [Candidatus Omnitrophota bacterium]|nr:Trm112 family protein [Candidatus Omnitrophota bacterium]
MIDKKLLEMLACPACKKEVRLEAEEIVCVGCKKRYPIRNGIPIMLIEESKGPDKS